MLVPMVVGYIFLIPYIFPFVFPQYAEGVPFTQIYSLSLLFFPTLILSTALVAQKREKELWVSRTIFPFVRLAVLVPAVQLGGLHGMVVGVVAVSALELISNLLALYWPKKSAL
jgi:O-antigen/teichoic acid export membrane protein